MPNSPVSVALLNDYEVVVEGLRQTLERFSDRVQIEDVTIEAPQGASVDIALYDAFGTPAREGQWSQLLGSGWSAKTVVLYTWRPEHELTRATREDWPLRVSKTLDGEAFVEAIEQIHSPGELGEPVESDDGSEHDEARCWPGKDVGLTEGEANVLALIALGLGNNEIADELFYSVNTIKTRIRGLYRKIGAQNRVDAVHCAVDHGFRH